MRQGRHRDQGAVTRRLAVFDGFHAWKHATRFGFPLEGCVTDDAAGVVALAATLAPDLIDGSSGVPSSIDVVSTEALAERCLGLGLRGVHHTRVVAWGRVPVEDDQMCSAASRAARSSVPAVLVDGARHPGNLGAVIRVAAAAGSPVVFSLGGVDPWLPEVIRAAAGLHAALPVLDVAHLDQIEGPLLVLDADGAPIGASSLAPGAVLAVGAERKGVSAAVAERADGAIALPMQPGVSSLNLATSVAAALYVYISRL